MYQSKTVKVLFIVLATIAVIGMVFLTIAPAFYA
jgi:hypothetical protein